MPLPLILYVIIEAAIWVVQRWAVRAAITYGVNLLLAKLGPFMARWLEEYTPTIVKYMIREGLGIDIDYPMTPQSFTTAINKKLQLDGVFALTDVTSKEAVRKDCERIAAYFIKQTLPGINEQRLRFTPGYRDDLKAAILAEIRRQIRQGMESGSSPLFTHANVLRIFEIAQQGYTYTKPVNIDSPKHEAGRKQARWCRQHMTKTWVQNGA